jgi:hypothetical protein
MLGTLVLATALSLTPNQAGQLKLTNDRVTYGYLGPTREDAKLLAGDSFFVAFDIEGLSEAEDGTVLYSMGMDVLNSKGGKEFSKEPVALTSNNTLGGKRMPGFMASDIGADTAPGKYTLKVTVNDRRANTKAELSRDFEVLPPELGVVQLRLTTVAPEQQQLPVPPVGVVGQSILVNFGVMGFTRNKEKDGQPDVVVAVSIRDEQGNLTQSKPYSEEANKDVPKTLVGIPVGIPVHLNRAGKFTVEIEATDKLANKKAKKLSFSLQVLEQK